MEVREENANAGDGHITVAEGDPNPLAWDSAAFWQCAGDLDEVAIRIVPPTAPLAILERLGPSPFPRGGFPLIGFLATTYEKVSRYALEGM